ncbi:MAG: 50S ribosomal protein L4 [Ignavibacteriaceae bacterium]|nr:50S ribosomal protein L4 [Ignavibacteriaceae bacterium]
MLTGKNETNVYKSGRNINKVSIMEASKASTYDILNNQILVLQKTAVDAIAQTFNEKEAKVVN